MKPLYITVFAVFLAYLAFSFGESSFDISTWSERIRGGGCAVMATIALIGVCVALIIKLSEGIFNEQIH